MAATITTAVNTNTPRMCGSKLVSWAGTANSRTARETVPSCTQPLYLRREQKYEVRARTGGAIPRPCRNALSAATSAAFWQSSTR